MSSLRTKDPDQRQLPARFVLQLFDGYTGASEAVGGVAAKLKSGLVSDPDLDQKPEIKGKRLGPLHRAPEATFVWLEIPPGEYAIQVRSQATPPFYHGRDYQVTIPPLPDPGDPPPPPRDPTLPPVWPGIPDISLADRTLPLDSPAQDVRYVADRSRATLQPTCAYPFPFDATLVRGTVLREVGGEIVPVEGATVKVDGRLEQTESEADGQYVLFFRDFPKSGQARLLASHGNSSFETPPVALRRGATVAVNLQLPT